MTLMDNHFWAFLSTQFETNLTLNYALYLRGVGKVVIISYTCKLLLLQLYFWVSEVMLLSVMRSMVDSCF